MFFSCREASLESPPSALVAPMLGVTFGVAAAGAQIPNEYRHGVISIESDEIQTI